MSLGLGNEFELVVFFFLQMMVPLEEFSFNVVKRVVMTDEVALIKIWEIEWREVGGRSFPKEMNPII